MAVIRSAAPLKLTCEACYHVEDLRVIADIDRIVVRAMKIDAGYQMQESGPGFAMISNEYIATNGQQGRRTQIYINPEAARRAYERGDLFTLAEYTEMTTISPRADRRARGGVRSCLAFSASTHRAL